MNKEGKLTKIELDACLDQLTKAHNKVHTLRAKIERHSIAVYGADPADIDCDQFIDGADGGCGVSEGMTTDEFHKEMLLSMKDKGMDTDSVDWK